MYSQVPLEFIKSIVTGGNGLEGQLINNLTLTSCSNSANSEPHIHPLDLNSNLCVAVIVLRA